MRSTISKISVRKQKLLVIPTRRPSIPRATLTQRQSRSDIERILDQRGPRNLSGRRVLAPIVPRQRQQLVSQTFDDTKKPPTANNKSPADLKLNLDLSLVQGVRARSQSSQRQYKKSDGSLCSIVDEALAYSERVHRVNPYL